MGPRHFSRGKEFHVITGSLDGSALQWGHGISAVESRNAGFSCVIIWWLQWGHGISAVESTEKQLKKDRKDLASMGPRHFSRGKLSKHRKGAKR